MLILLFTKERVITFYISLYIDFYSLHNLPALPSVSPLSKLEYSPVHSHKISGPTSIGTRLAAECRSVQETEVPLKHSTNIIEVLHCATVRSLKTAGHD